LGYVGSGVAKLLINLFLCMLPCCPLWYAFFHAFLLVCVVGISGVDELDHDPNWD
jgi:hypothetical protein